jgi:hypothetical protein
MAVIRQIKSPKPLRIERFLGLNEDTTGDTQLQIGESPNMTNFRLSENYKLEKREGYSELFSTQGAYRTRGMWYGDLNGNQEFLFNLNQKIFREESISGTDYFSIDTSSYALVDVVITTAIITPLAGTTGVDGFTIYTNKSGETLTEVSQANIDLTASIGKYYYHTDRTIFIIVEKGSYATIALARTALGTSTVYVAINYSGSYLTIDDADMHFFTFEDTVTVHPAAAIFPAGSVRTYTRETKVYMLNGVEYYSWTGKTLAEANGVFEVVKGYTPLILISTPNTGGGTTFEVINSLTGSKRQQFNGLAASNTVYQLAEKVITAIDYVYANGVRVEEGALTGQFTKNLTNGTVQLNGNVFLTGTNNVEIYWTKGTGTRTDITDNKYSVLFGGKNDTRVFVYGENTNRFHYTDLADGVFSADYFPSTYFQEVGSPESKITGIIRQYDRLIIFTNEAAYYSFYETTLINDISVPDFPSFPLNQAKGNSALGQVALIQNNPFTLWEGVQEWIATNVRDERNANYISKRVQETLDSKDLSTALTIDWERNYEYWICFDNIVVIYNYRLNVWYKFELKNNVTSLYIRENNLYFGTNDGRIMKFDSDLESDQGLSINGHWESGFYDFEAEYLQKFIDEMWISIQPSVKTAVNITYQTDRNPLSQVYTASINLFTFDNINFGEFTFLTSVVPQPFRIKIKAKKFVYFKLNLDNDTNDEKLTVLALNLAYNTGSKSK